MQISHNLPQFLDKKALIITTAKEQGVIYLASGGMIEKIERVVEHAPTYSDREGFFFSSGHGTRYGSGAPFVEDKQENINHYVKKMADKLNQVIRREKPGTLFIFEPAYLKGRVQNALQTFPKLEIHTVRYGNYVNEPASKLLSYIAMYQKTVIVKVG